MFYHSLSLSLAHALQREEEWHRPHLHLSAPSQWPSDWIGWQRAPKLPRTNQDPSLSLLSAVRTLPRPALSHSSLAVLAMLVATTTGHAQKHGSTLFSGSFIDQLVSRKGLWQHVCTYTPRTAPASSRPGRRPACDISSSTFPANLARSLPHDSNDTRPPTRVQNVGLRAEMLSHRPHQPMTSSCASVMLDLDPVHGAPCPP
jgi:hypothetical protein